MLDYSKLELKENEIYYNHKKMPEEICNGYVYVIDWKTGKKFRKHRIVWEIYNKKKIPNNMVINHIDGNKLNNSIENLEVVTIKENTKHWYDNLNKNNLIDNFNGKSVYAYYVYTGEEKFFKTITEAAEELGITTQMISTVLTGKQKTTKDYIFSYEKINDPVDYIIKNIDYDKIKNFQERTIVAFFPDDTTKTFYGINEAREYFDCSIGSLRRWINGTRKNKNGITFIAF